METMKVQSLAIGQIAPNDGQVEGLPRNPRFIRDEKFEALKRSIMEDPEMLQMRPVMVYPYNGEYVAIGGNMRLAAMKELGYTDVPCVVIPEGTTPDKLRAYTMKDNYGYGEWDASILADEWDMSELDAWDMNDILGFDISETEVEDEASFSGKNKEIDVDGFEEKIVVKLELTIDENRFFIEQISKIGGTKESVILNALGYEPQV